MKGATLVVPKIGVSVEGYQAFRNSTNLRRADLVCAPIPEAVPRVMLRYLLGLWRGSFYDPFDGCSDLAFVEVFIPHR
jgi:hypothetical protein